MHFRSLFLENFFGHSPNDAALVGHLFQRGRQRDHYLRVGLDAFLRDDYGRLENCSRLHLGNLGIGDA